MSNFKNMDTKGKVIVFLVGVNIFLVVGLLFKSKIDSYRQRTEAMRLAENRAIIIEKQGEMSREEYMKLTAIRFDITTTKGISDTELDWLSAMIHRSLSDSSIKGRLLRGDVAMTLEVVQSSTPQQKAKMIDLGTALIHNPEVQGDDSDKIFGLKILRGVKGPEAIPAILPLLDDKRPDVQRSVKHTLKLVGYRMEASK